MFYNLLHASRYNFIVYRNYLLTNQHTHMYAYKTVEFQREKDLLSY